MNNLQRTFCQEYVKNGLNGTDAYMKAYKTCKKEETARVNASRLLTNANIQEYIKELQSKVEKKHIMSIEERMDWLTELIKSNKENANNKLKALEILNKMDGVYTQNISVKGDMNLNNPLRELTTDQIIEMINNEK